MDLMTFSLDSLKEPSQYLTMKSWDIKCVWSGSFGYSPYDFITALQNTVTPLPLKTLLPDLESDRGTNQP